MYDHDATELQLHIENTYGHYAQLNSIRANLVRKIASGKYDHQLAPKLWRHLADAGAKRYAREHGHAFDVRTRQAVANAMADEFRAEVKDGNLDDHPALTGVYAQRAEASGGLRRCI